MHQGRDGGYGTMMKLLEEAQHRETLSIAEQADAWRLILKSAGRKERAAFWVWAKQSSLHVREVLLAEAFDAALAKMELKGESDFEKLMADGKSAPNVVPLRK
jgi:hypothetical protein